MRKTRMRSSKELLQETNVLLSRIDFRGGGSGWKADSGVEKEFIQLREKIREHLEPGMSKKDRRDQLFSDCERVGLEIEEPCAIGVKWLYESGYTDLSVGLLMCLLEDGGSTRIRVDHERDDLEEGLHTTYGAVFSRIWRHTLLLKDPEDDADEIEFISWTRRLSAGPADYKSACWDLSERQYAWKVEKGWVNWSSYNSYDRDDYSWRDRAKKFMEESVIKDEWPPPKKLWIRKKDVPHLFDQKRPYR